MRKFSFIIVLFLLFFGLIAVWWINGRAAVSIQDKTAKIFVIEKGQGIRDIANKLKTEGLINDPVVFFLIVKQLNLDGKIQAGSFRLSPSMTAETIANELTHGTIDTWITIPEGKRAEEIAELLQNYSNFTPSWKDELKKHEGYLFPDTYLIPKDASIDTIITIMKSNFDNKWDMVTISSSLSKEEIVTIASLIEREAKHDEDRPLVASVIYNRLALGMPLQIDATVQYALGYNLQEQSWWKKELTFDDLKVDSEYNTYKITTLPPRPIANPGFLAIKAAANPSQTKYLYYLSDKTGVNHYSQTLAEHNANIKKYGL